MHGKLYYQSFYTLCTVVYIKLLKRHYFFFFHFFLFIHILTAHKSHIYETQSKIHQQSKKKIFFLTLETTNWDIIQISNEIKALLNFSSVRFNV